MTFYFQLQYKRLERRLTDFGINPMLGILLSLLIFVALSKYLFYKTEYAYWVYSLIAISLILQLGEIKRTDHLKLIFNLKDYYRIRMIENIGCVFPFLAYLMYEGNYAYLFSLFTIAIFLVIINFKQTLSFVTPTPFRKLPFEFILGFRVYFIFFLLAYFLLFKGLQADNFNLSITSLGMIFLISMIFYFKPEGEYYVWIYNLNSRAFLLRKILISIICVSILTLPAIIVLIEVYATEWDIIIIVQIIGYIYLTSMVLAKYSAFPQEMSVPQGVLYGLSLWFPPLLMIIIPIFYFKAIKRLNPVLK